jgi:hypothetical protein
LHNGEFQLSQDDLLTAYREWRNDDVILHFEDANGEYAQTISSKRGNWVYAYNKRKKMKHLQTGMDGLIWDYEVPASRSKVIRKTHLLFITLTFSHRDYTIQDSWRLITSRGQALNRFSARLSKIVGNKATYKAKEAQESGYAAPHIMVILDRPVTVFKHGKTWRIRDKRIVQQIKDAWPYGFSDVQACVGGKVRGSSPISYMMKYATKTLTRDVKSKHGRIAELTHAWNKVFGTRDVIGRQFLERLNLHAVDPTASPSGWVLTDIEYRPDIIRLFTATGSGPEPFHGGG